MIRLSLVIPPITMPAQLVALESVVRQDLPPHVWECVVVQQLHGRHRDAFRGVRRGRIRTSVCGSSRSRGRVSCPQPGLRRHRRRWWPSSTTTNGESGILRAYLDFSVRIPKPSWPAGASSQNIRRGVPTGCRNTSRCRSPIRWISALTCVRFLRDGFRGGNMAFRRAGLAGYRGFDPSAGARERRVDRRRGERLFERPLRAVRRSG